MCERVIADVGQLALAVLTVAILTWLWSVPGGSGSTFGLALGVVLPIVLIVWGVVLFGVGREADSPWE
jgi:hypothetical protein